MQLKESIIPKNGYRVLVLFLSILSAFKTYGVLCQTPFANGWDAYFYLDQIKYWLEQGELHTSRYSLYYPFLVVIHFFTDNYILTYKIGVSLCMGGITTISIFIVQQFQKNNILSFLTGVYTISSLQLEYFAANYGKNLLGIFFFMTLILLIQLKSKKGVFIGFVSNIFTHKLTGGLSLIVYLIHTYFSKIKSLKPKWKLIFSIAAIIMCVLFVFFLKQRQTNLISFMPQIQVYSFVSSVYSISKVHLVEMYFIFLFSLLIIIYRALKKSFDTWTIAIIALFILINFPFIVWDELGYSYRLISLLPIIFILILTVIPKEKYMLLLIGVFVIFLIPFKGYNPKEQDPPYLKFQRISNKLQELNIDTDLIIAHKTLAEYLSFNLNKDVMPWVPDYKVADEKLWRIVTDIPKRELEYFVGTDSPIEQLTINYYLVPEVAWQRTLLKIRTENIELYNKLNTWKNPHDIRPTYLK